LKKTNVVTYKKLESGGGRHCKQRIKKKGTENVRFLPENGIQTPGLREKRRSVTREPFSALGDTNFQVEAQ